MLFANTATGFPAVLVIVGVIVGVYGIWHLATGRAGETGSKIIVAGIGIMAVGIILAQF